EIHRRAIVIDTHADSTQRILRGVDFGKPQPDMHEDLTKMKAGGLDAQIFSIFVNPHTTKPGDYYGAAGKQIDADLAMMKANPKSIAFARTAAEIRANAGRGLISGL